MALDEYLWDEEEHQKRVKEKDAAVFYNRTQVDFERGLVMGTKAKTDIPITIDNPKGAGKPTLLAGKEIWVHMRDYAKTETWRDVGFCKYLKERGIDIHPQTITNWRFSNRRGFRDKVDFFIRDVKLQKMLETAIENQKEVLEISLEDGLSDPRVLAIRQKATEHILDTLGAEMFSREKEKSTEDKAEQMIRMRLMLQKLIGETDKPVVYDAITTTNSGISSGNVQDSGGGTADTDPEPVRDLRADLQKASQTSES